VAGGSWVNVGLALSAQLTGLSLGTSYLVEVQALDAANNAGNASATLTTSAFYTDNMAFVGGYTGDGWTYSFEGYQQPSFGSLSPATTNNGKTIIAFTAYVDFTSWWGQATLSVTGFNGNPGSGWLNSVTVAGAGIALTGASATFSCSSSTTCAWRWPGWSGSFSGSGTLTIEHQ
jgi:hypothetical protein